MLQHYSFLKIRIQFFVFRSFGHPYLVELTRWEPSDSMLTTVEPQTPKKVDETPLIEVSNARDLNCMLKDLMYAKEIAVDLEHHSYRSFLGLTCLMQISTREKDYVIDGFTLREDLYLLNDIFADPKIVKVCNNLFVLTVTLGQFHEHTSTLKIEYILSYCVGFSWCCV